MARGNYDEKTYKKFKWVLNKANLQCPTSSYDPKCSRHAGDFKGFANDHFYYEDNALVFEMCDKHKRSELRFLKEWKFSDNKYYVFKCAVKPIPHTDAFTFIQIHGIKDELNKPVLRIAIYGKKIRAIIYDGEKYIKYTLGELKEERYIPFKVVAGKGKLIIYKDYEKKLSVPITYPSACFYKCGVYLQRNGCAKAMFKSIGGNL